MPVKKYGIYLAYGPRVDLRTEGLGRHLAEFLKASRNFEDTKFVIAAPRWLDVPLRDLLENFDLDVRDFEVVAPRRPSLLSLLYGAVTAISDRRKMVEKRIGRGRLRKVKQYLYSKTRLMALSAARSRNPFVAIVSLVLAIIAAPIVLVGAVVASIVGALLLKPLRRMRLRSRLVLVKRKLNAGGWLTKLNHNAYRLMCDAEASAVADEANKLRDVEAWYAPTAFWPEFNRIQGPRLLCVPDVVPVHYSVAFATEEPNGDRRLHDFKRIEATIEGGDRFVTYSSEIRDGTLVDRFHIDPDRVDVIPHGANRLDHLVNITGFANDDEATDTLSAQHLWGALAKTVNNEHARWYTSKELGFIFYASQIRPNKNVMTLLRAYHHLRRTKNLPYKLLMTGEWRGSADVMRFMNENRLHDDVLFVRGLSEKELAACYRLATLAINPSLAEGGMPFTLTESVSVGTPVVMADIPVSREIIVDETVADRTFFDGFDYRDMARAILEALSDVGGLYALQRGFYDRRLASRSWREVVREYIGALEKCAASRAGN
jgi:glycosyltransferase involved in cell wall biosynthesis